MGKGWLKLAMAWSVGLLAGDGVAIVKRPFVSGDECSASVYVVELRDSAVVLEEECWCDYFEITDDGAEWEGDEITRISHFSVTNFLPGPLRYVFEDEGVQYVFLISETAGGIETESPLNIRVEWTRVENGVLTDTAPTIDFHVNDEKFIQRNGYAILCVVECAPRPIPPVPSPRADVEARSNKNSVSAFVDATDQILMGGASISDRIFTKLLSRGSAEYGNWMRLRVYADADASMDKVVSLFNAALDAGLFRLSMVVQGNEGEVDLPVWIQTDNPKYPVDLSQEKFVMIDVEPDGFAVDGEACTIARFNKLFQADSMPGQAVVFRFGPGVTVADVLPLFSIVYREGGEIVFPLD